MGFVVAYTDYPAGRRTEIVELLARTLKERYHINSCKSGLYECARLVDSFSGSYEDFVRWMNETSTRLGRQLYWYDVQRLRLGGDSNPAVIGREAADQRDFLAAEKGIEALERVLTRASEGDEEAIGVAEGLRQSIEGLQFLTAAPKEIRSKEYRSFVSSFPCLVCGGVAEAHHAVGRRGVAVKPSDYGCVPLCRGHHAEMHDVGSETLQRWYSVDFLEAAFNLLHKYVAGTWITMVLEANAGDHKIVRHIRDSRS